MCICGYLGRHPAITVEKTHSGRFRVYILIIIAEVLLEMMIMMSRHEKI